MLLEFVDCSHTIIKRKWANVFVLFHQPSCLIHWSLKKQLVDYSQESISLLHEWTQSPICSSGWKYHIGELSDLAHMRISLSGEPLQTISDLLENQLGRFENQKQPTNESGDLYPSLTGHTFVTWYRAVFEELLFAWDELCGRIDHQHKTNTWTLGMVREEKKLSLSGFGLSIEIMLHLCCLLAFGPKYLKYCWLWTYRRIGIIFTSDVLCTA